MTRTNESIRNVAIIAHVDHGKTTLVDGMLKQSNVFRQHEDVGSLIMDSNELEREKGITILAKNTAVNYRGVKINIIDTPGHADFGGEVERVLNMADGCLLLIDAAEGPMPQTRFVLRKAMEIGLRPIVVINKVDRPNARVDLVLRQTQDLFLDLATESDQLEFPVLFSVAKQGVAMTHLDEPQTDLHLLFQAIVDTVPAPAIEEGPLQMLVTTLGYDSYQGRIAIGRIVRGAVEAGQNVSIIGRLGSVRQTKVVSVHTFAGLRQLPVDRAVAGEIVALTGIEDATIGETVAAAECPEPLPVIEVEEPTVRMTVGVNTSPFAGREGTMGTSRQLRERLYRELQTNVALRVDDMDRADAFLVSGRGELHLAILIETMRREGYEFEVSRPEAITHIVDGKVHEPFEHLVIDTTDDYMGFVTQALPARKGSMIDIVTGPKGDVRIEYTIPTRGLIGFRNEFLTATRGNGVMNSIALGYRPWAGDISSYRMGALVALEEGTAVSYGLANAQDRGTTFVEPGTPVYGAMIVGLNARGDDIVINVSKDKKKTNVRASTSDILVRLTPSVTLSLEQSLDFLQDDELLEVTPQSLRLRKRVLSHEQRGRNKKRAG
ncbi:MAG: translational GTPase TypA [Chloroflexota bacterium]|nr:MAG: translational GTPase TypA [Chloroflexota bacterium]